MSNYIDISHEYIKKLTKKERSGFISILCTLANIDGKISTDELLFIQETADQIDLEIKPSFFSCSVASCTKIASTISNRRLALETLKYMLALAYTDNNFSDTEAHFIQQITQALKIEPQKVKDMSSWIIDRIIWLEEGHIIFEENTDSK
jgi:uncharacterized tellurite resistance protein B-like protein